MHDWVNGTDGRWVTMEVPSDNNYNIPENLIFSMPVNYTPNSYHIVKDLPVGTVSRLHLKRSIQEL